MPEHYRALACILTLAVIVFVFAKVPATVLAMSADDFVRRRNCWIFITVAAFLSPNFWIFATITIVLLNRCKKNEKNIIALYCFLLLAIPNKNFEIPGIGPIRYFFTINYIDILTIFLLIPLCFILHRRALVTKAKSSFADRFIVAYVLVNIGVFINGGVDAFGIIRAAISWLLTVLIPYYAISRGVKDIESFRDVIMSCVIAAMLSSIVSIFEFFWHWLLYASLDTIWGLDSMLYLRRAGLVRTMSTSGNTIILGYVLAVAIGLYLYARHIIPSRLLWFYGLILLVAGEITPLSKGPWVGVMVILFVYLALSPARASHFAKLLIIFPVIAIVLPNTDVGQIIIGFLPFVGTVDEGSSTYRQLVFEVSWQQIMRYPFFGTLNYEVNLEELRQGQGIIDIVNSFVQVALLTGLIGLTLFLSFFATIMIGVYRATLSVKDNPELLALGNALIAILIGILVMIASVSSIAHVVIIYILIAALGAAYCSFVQEWSRNRKLARRGLVKLTGSI
jgi:hypothetical protein